VLDSTGGTPPRLALGPAALEAHAVVVEHAHARVLLAPGAAERGAQRPPLVAHRLVPDLGPREEAFEVWAQALASLAAVFFNRKRLGGGPSLDLRPRKRTPRPG